MSPAGSLRREMSARFESVTAIGKDSVSVSYQLRHVQMRHTFVTLDISTGSTKLFARVVPRMEQVSFRLCIDEGDHM